MFYYPIKYESQFIWSHLKFQVAAHAFPNTLGNIIWVYFCSRREEIVYKCVVLGFFYFSDCDAYELTVFLRFFFLNAEIMKLLYMVMYLNVRISHHSAAWVMRLPDHLSCAGIREWGMCHILFKQPDAVCFGGWFTATPQPLAAARVVERFLPSGC